MFQETNKNLLLTSPLYAKQKDYWLEELSGEIVKTRLLHQLHREKINSAQTGAPLQKASIPIAPGTCSTLLKLSKQTPLSIYLILLSTLKTLIHYYTGNNEITVISPLYSPNISGDPLNNHTYIRTRNLDTLTFKELLLEIRRSALGAYENQDYPFETLIDLLFQSGQITDKEPFSNVHCLLRNIHENSNGRPVKSPPAALCFSFNLEDARLCGHILYNPNIYDNFYPRQLAEHFGGILENALENIDRPITGIPFLSREEKQQLIIDFNPVSVPYTGAKSIHKRFEEQAARTPDQPAVVYEDNVLTYSRLNEKADRLARMLNKQGINPGNKDTGNIVAIMMEMSTDVIIAILGILKAGGAYLPLAPGFPRKRIRYMLNDLFPRTLLTHEKVTQQPEFAGEIIHIEPHIDTRTETPYPLDPKNNPGGNNAESPLHTEDNFTEDNFHNLAYVMYTSGSTGKPKGIMIEHGNVLNLVDWFGKTFNIREGANVLQLTDYTFDPSIEDIFATLLHGGTLHVANPGLATDREAFRKYVDENQIHIINFVPTFLEELLGTGEKLESLRAVISGGEPLEESLKNRLIANGYQLFNHYGPTEITTDALTTRCSLEKSVVLGKPIANCQAYVLGEKNQLCPPGVIGELCISGAGLARGYINRPLLTQESFQPHPFIQGQRIYRTGDLAAWLPDGNIRYLGRKDQQIKIRGFRIEPGEIESKLLAHQDIKEVVILVEADNEDKYICAYIVPISGKTIEIQVLREYLARELPDYMIPSHLVTMKQIPLTPNGKIDRRALPGPRTITTANYTAPRDEIEKKMAEVWARVLGVAVEAVGIDTNFFELGGHSLKATMLIAEMHKTFHVVIPLADIFKNTTIRELRTLVEKQAKHKFQSIKAAEIKEFYPLSPAQRRLFVWQQMHPGSTAYNMPVIIPWPPNPEHEPEPEPGIIEKTFIKLIKRHESLRTTFHLLEGEPVQKIHDNAEFKIEFHNIKTRAETRANDSIPNSKLTIQNLVNDFVRPFDLSQAPLLRAGLIKTRDNDHFLLVDIHHIICDGISHDILKKDFTGLYKNRPLPPLIRQYKDFSEWQNNSREKENIKKQGEYWLNLFSGDIPVLNLPTDFPRPPARSFDGNIVPFQIPAGPTAALKTAALAGGSSLYIVLLSVFNILLSKLSGQEDIIVGTPVAGRRHADLDKIIGMFVNTLALRNNPKGQITIEKFLADVKKKTLRAFDHQDYPVEDLVESVACDRDAGRNPLFDFVFVLHNDMAEPGAAMETPGQPEHPLHDIESRTAKFDITLHIANAGDTFACTFEYCSRLFKEETIRRYILYINNIVSAVTSNPGTLLADIEIITQEEKQQLLYRFNDTDAAYPDHKTIHQIFEEQVRKTPDNTAIIHDDTETGLRCTLTYKELNQQAGHMARMLAAKGISYDSIVALMVPRSPQMLIAILAVLKAGGAYLPIDPHYPRERIHYILADSNAKILLATRSSAPKITVAPEILYMEETRSAAQSPYGNTAPLPPRTPHPRPASSLAYIIYTSGSTGRPKGAMIQHNNVVRLFFNDKCLFPFTHSDTWSLFHSYCFDFSVWEMYGALLFGGRLVVIPKTVSKDPGKFTALLKKENVTVLNQTPSAFYYLAEEVLKENTPLPHLKYVIFGGEALNPARLKEWNHKYPNIKLINMYGITETTVHVTYKEIDKPEIASGSSNIGLPIPTLRTYIMDANMKLQPIGIPGQLTVAGDGVGRGYLNRPELTAQLFTENPYKPGERLYHSGDMAKQTPGGEMVYMGRNDDQVKIRGFRIEPGEIEQRLTAHPGIKEAVLLVHRDSSESAEQHLRAYIVADKKLEVSLIRKHLSKELPEYMIPSYFIFPDHIPLTPNGKVDKKALLQYRVSSTGKTESVTLPRDEVEIKLHQIWSDVLELPPNTIGIDTDFFESGGHSLKATKLVAGIHKTFDVVIPLVELFQKTTIRELARYVKTREKNIFKSIEAAEIKEFYPLTAAQRRIFVWQQMQPQGTAYNMPVIIPWSSNTEQDMESESRHIEKIFFKLIKRHESLRTTFHMLDGELVQKIHDHTDFKIEYLETKTGTGTGANDLTPNSKLTIQNLVNDFVSPFDLSKPPLLRGILIKNQNNDCFLLVDIHHIISDGISHDILRRDFIELYKNRPLPPLNLQYKDYSEWRNNPLEKENIKKQENYWLKIFAGDIPVLNLPTDFPRTAVRSFEGDTESFQVPAGPTAALKTAALAGGSSLYVMLLSVFNILLSKLSGQQDIIVGTPVAGRRHADLENIIGMFVNTLALRNHPKGEKTFMEFLAQVKERTLEAFDNQDYPVEDLAASLAVNRDSGRNSLFDVLFTLHNDKAEPAASMETAGHPVPPAFNIENKTAKFDIILHIADLGDTLACTFEYCSKLFTKQTMSRCALYINNIVSAVTADPLLPLSCIEIITHQEKQRLLYRFNDTGAAYPRDKTIHQIFEEQVQKTPGNTAVVYEDIESKHRGALTYKELDQKAGELARVLTEKGVSYDSIAAIMVHRSHLMLIAILAILKAGGAYLPIDPDYPGERINYILADSNTRILLTTHASPPQITFSKERLYLDAPTLSTQSATQSAAPSSPGNTVPQPPSSLAYIIYTSGSTGRPKGVMIQHDNLVRLFFNDKNLFDFNGGDTWSMFHSYCFDFSVWEMYGALLFGGRLVVVPKTVAKNPGKFLALLKKEAVTVLNQTPSAFYYLAGEALKDKTPELYLRYVIFGGEALNPARLKEWHHQYPRIKLINMYGITETTVHVTYKEIGKQEIASGRSNIGHPIPTLRSYIMDGNMKLQPIGVPGELAVAGDGVGRGYLNRPELTAERFIENPYIPGERIYRSGDMAKQTDSGEMVYMGRNDDQVKIRGFRIEPGEIEQQLTAHPAIKEAVILIRQGTAENEEKHLWAYVVADKKQEISHIRTYLSKELPDYMIPSYFIFLDHIPLTPNGKTDKRALLQYQFCSDRKPGNNTAPPDEVETKLRQLWADVLGLPPETIGLDTSFFELGGHSLNAGTLVAMIHKTFHIKMPLGEVFINPDIRSMAEFTRSAVNDAFITILPVEKKDYYRVSPGQKRLYILQRLYPREIGYNIPLVIPLEEKADPQKMQDTFIKLIRRHESLRTSFHMPEAEPVQKVHGKEDIDFEVQLMKANTKTNTGSRTGETHSVQDLISLFIRPFELSAAPLLRAGLIQKDQENTVLVVDIHHIISDGISHDILVTDFIALYNGEELPALPLQYKDYAEWQAGRQAGEAVKQQEAYWLSVFKEKPPMPAIPTDYPRPRVKSFAGDRVSFSIGRELSASIKRLLGEMDVTLYMFLLAVYTILLSKYSGREDIVIGTPVAGRMHADLHRIIGNFVNMLAMRNFPSADKTFAAYQEEVKVNTLAAFQNQDYQFDELVNHLDRQENAGKDPLVNTVLQTHRQDGDNTDNSHSPNNEYRHNVTKYDLVLETVDTGEQIICVQEYATSLFKRETIEKLTGRLLEVIKQVVDNNRIPISQITMGHKLHGIGPEIDDGDFGF